jgi:acyl-coenzyme A synthetase/AMP-(fatty) acid ligase
VDGYRGRFVDMDRGVVLEPAAFARGWRELTVKLEQHGLCEADRVVMAVGNGPLFCATLAAILSCGGSPLLLHGETPVAELRRTAARFHARFVICDAAVESELAATGVPVHTLSGPAWVRVLWSEVGHPGEQVDLFPLPGVPLHPTSGTTGESKIAARPGPCAVAEAEHYAETLGIDAGDTLLALAPMCHAYAYGMCAMVPLVSGASLVSMRKFSPKLVFQALDDYRVTVMPAVPVMLDMLLFGAGRRLRRPGLRVLTAGSPLPLRTALDYKQASGTSVQPLYGTTETGGISVSVADYDPPTGCVGPSMHGVEVEVRHPNGAELEGGLGNVYVSSSSMMAGYVTPQGLDRTPIVDGWFRTGDLGCFDRFGYLHLKGRETDVINVFGMKVVPSEVEEVLRQLPEVREVKVYAGQNVSGSQFVKAAIVAPGLAVAQIRAHCEKHLVYYKRPDAVLLLDALPKTPSGKVIRDRLP